MLIAGAYFMENLDATIIAPAAPAIAESLGVEAVQINVAMTAYLLTVAVLIPASGWLSDRYGARGIFSLAIAVFTVASVGCAVAPTLTALARRQRRQRGCDGAADGGNGKHCDRGEKMPRAPYRWLARAGRDKHREGEQVGGDGDVDLHRLDAETSAIAGAAGAMMMASRFSMECAPAMSMASAGRAGRRLLGEGGWKGSSDPSRVHLIARRLGTTSNDVAVVTILATRRRTDRVAAKGTNGGDLDTIIRWCCPGSDLGGEQE